MNSLSPDRAAPRRPSRPAACIRAAFALLSCAFLLAAQTPPAKTRSSHPGDSPKPKGTASIEGATVDAIDGMPLKEVTLLLMDTKGTGSPATVKSDDTGHFLFPNLYEGNYLLMGDHPRYARQTYGSRNGLLGGTPLALSTGQELKNLKFEMQPNAVISGRVLDEDGEPLANYMVTAARSYYQHGRKQFLPVGTSVTNDLGEYRIGNLAAGKYFVSALKSMREAPRKAAPTGPEMTYIPTYFPNSPEVSGATALTPSPGGELSGTDIRVARSKSVRIKGKVIGAPAGQQVTVRVASKDAGILAMMLGNGSPVKADGSFELVGVTPGDYLLRVTDQMGMKMMGAGLPIQVGDRPIEGLLLEVAAAADITGSIVLEGDGQASPKGAKVVLEPVEGGSILPPNTTAAEDGSFTLKEAPPDKYVVRVIGGPPGAYVKSVQFGTQDVDDHGLAMGGTAPGKLTIRMSTAGGEVNGIVRGQDDQPITGVTVALIPDSHNYLLYQSAFTDQHGAFRFAGVTPADYKLLAWEEVEPNAYEDPEFVKPVENKAERVTVKENDRKSVVLKAIPRD